MDNKMKGKKIEIKLVKSMIKRPKDQKATLEALGLRKLNSTVTHSVSPQIEGMVRKVSHLVTFEYK